MNLIFRREDLLLLLVISSVRSGANMPRRMIPVLSNCYCVFVIITLGSHSVWFYEKKKQVDTDHFPYDCPHTCHSIEIEKCWIIEVTQSFIHNGFGSESNPTA